jgi:hypothetical protein
MLMLAQQPQERRAAARRERNDDPIVLDVCAQAFAPINVTAMRAVAANAPKGDGSFRNGDVWSWHVSQVRHSQMKSNVDGSRRWISCLAIGRLQGFRRFRLLE